MITELTQEQKDKFPYYVKKWCDVGYNTELINFKKAQGQVAEAYKVAGLKPPTWYFKFGSPVSALYGIFFIDVLKDFTNNYTDTKLHYDFDAFQKNVFEELYQQYTEQYNNPEEITWNDETKARMLSYCSLMYNDSNTKTKIYDYFKSMMYGAHDAAWLSFYDFFWQEFHLDCIKDLLPSFDIAHNCGWWSAFADCAILQERPCKIVKNDQDQLHCEDGPAIEYPDGYKIYCLEGRWFDEMVVMDPNLITQEMIEGEQNAEKRRIILNRYGYERYFQNAECTVVDHDEVPVSVTDQRLMPRTLIKTKNGDLFLVGTDGSTKDRVYVMPILREIKTCKEAHQLISGLNEDKCLAQS